MTTRRPSLRTLGLAAGLVFAAAGLPGCNIIGPVGYLVAGPEKTPAMHTLDPKRTTVVFIDDRANRVPERSLRRRIAQAAEQELLDQKLVETVLSGESAMAVAARERFGKPMSIADIGAAVGAQVVVYVTVDEFAISSDGASYSPRATARVKVIDVENKSRTWPTEEPGSHTVVAQFPERQGGAPRSMSEISAAQRDLADELGSRLAKVFYKHETRPLGRRVGGE